MVSTSTISRSSRRVLAFTVVELMVGITIAAFLALAIAPVWISLERMGDGETDQQIWFLQSRVALAGFERDFRAGGAGDCLFASAGPILEATTTQVVVLVHKNEDALPVVVEWELNRGSLMRRWGQCPERRPLAWMHSAYRDSKTMLDHVLPDSGFVYYAGSRRLSVPVEEAQLASVTTVELELTGGAPGAPGTVDVSTTARVGW